MADVVTLFLKIVLLGLWAGFGLGLGLIVAAKFYGACATRAHRVGAWLAQWRRRDG